MGKKSDDTRTAGSKKSPPESPEKTQEEPPEFQIVGIGASAGGLSAMETFFRNLPADPGMAFVVVQHQSPDQKSILDALVAKYTDLPVVVIEDGLAAQPDTVYIRPPDRKLGIRDGRFVFTAEPSKTPQKLIDNFFCSLAEDQGENAVCVLLSGAGADGSQGCKAINASGGLVMAQDEQSAEYPDMPRAAIGTGLVDFILPPERMGEKLTEYARHSRRVQREIREGNEDARLEKEQAQILRIVREKTSHDFSCYKRSTIDRRIRRRMAMHRCETIGDYGVLLRRDPGEIHELFSDLLINVTSFFRDPEAWEALEKEVDRMLAERSGEDPFRVWVPGCADGQEAYSLAMLLAEATERAERPLPVKIFATDLNEPSIMAGRSGLYPESIAEEMPEQRLRRHFTREGDRYRVSAHLREMVIFSPHNLAADSPFSNLDLVSCRNLLIYMAQPLQRKILPLLHFSLKEGGLLFLGTSEDVGPFGDLFAPVSRKWRIFRTRRASRERHQEIFSLLGRTSAPVHSDHLRIHDEPTGPSGPPASAAQRRDSLRDLVEKTIIDEYAPPSVLVDGRNRICYFHGDTHPFLVPPQGEAVFDLLRMVRSELHSELEFLLREARKGSQRRGVRRRGQFFLEDRTVQVELSARPVPYRTAEKELLLVTFRREKEEAAGGEEAEADTRVAALQRELYGTRQDLQSTIEELETTNEELQSANEELQANNEELQSTNEEMETSREELQSTNEEMETVNAELRSKNEELREVNDDMENLFAATDVCTIIVDRELCIKRFTPAATRILRLRERDQGRPVTDLASVLVYDDFQQDVESVVEDLERIRRQVLSREGQWFEIRIIPYRTSRDVIAGAVISIIDITDQKETEIEAKEGKLLADSILETLREPLLVLREDLKVLQGNRAFYRFFRVEAEETEDAMIFKLGKNQWDIPDLRRLLLEIVPDNSEIRDYRVEGEFPGIGPRTLLLNARRIDRGDEKPKLILLTFHDVTGRDEERERDA